MSTKFFALSQVKVFLLSGWISWKSFSVTLLISDAVLFLANPATKNFEALSIYVTRNPRWLPPIIVSLSQWPISVFWSAIAGRSLISTRSGIPPRLLFAPFRLFLFPRPWRRYSWYFPQSRVVLIDHLIDGFMTERFLTSFFQTTCYLFGTMIIF